MSDNPEKPVKKPSTTKESKPEKKQVVLSPSDVLETRLIDYFAIITPVSRTCTCDLKTNTYYCDCDISYRYPQKDFKDFEFPTKLEWFAFPNGIKCFSRYPSIKDLRFPNALRVSIAYLDPAYLGTEGLFIKSGEAKAVNTLLDLFHKDEDFEIPKTTSPHIVATALKRYLQTMEPILPYDLIPQIESVGNRSVKDVTLTLEAIAQILPERSIMLLSLVGRFYQRIADYDEEEDHEAYLDNFAKSVLYSLIRPEKEKKFGNEDIMKTFIALLIKNAVKLFPEPFLNNLEEEDNELPTNLIIKNPPEDEVYTCVLNVGDHQSYAIFRKYFTPYALSNSQPSKRIYAPNCICFITRYPFVDVITQCLNVFVDIANYQHKEVEKFIGYLFQDVPVPIPGALSVTFTLNDLQLSCALPCIGDFPLRSSPLIALFSSFSIRNVLTLFTALCTEQRLIFHSKNLNRLTVICEALNCILYPFAWRRVYVPILPIHLIEYMEAPLAFILGIHSDLLHEVDSCVYDGVILIDIDTGKITGDSVLKSLPPLPSKEVNNLYHSLYAALYPNLVYNDFSNEKEIEHPLPNTFIYTKSLEKEQIEVQIRSSFVRFFAESLNGYHHCLFFLNDKMPVFNKQQFFTDYASPDAEPFLSPFFDSQIFAVFKDRHDSEEYQIFHSIYYSISKGIEIPNVDELRKIPKNFQLPAYKYSLFTTKESEIPQYKLDESKIPKPRKITKKFISEKLKMKVEDLQNMSWGELHHFLDDIENRNLSEEDTKIEAMIQQCLTMIFGGEIVPMDLLGNCIRGFSSKYARDLLILIMKQPGLKRSDGGMTLTSDNFENLVRLTNAMVSECDFAHDYANARECIDIASSFYTQPTKYAARTPNGNEIESKIYLMKRIRRQEIWSRSSFWYETFHAKFDKVQGTGKQSGRKRAGSMIGGPSGKEDEIEAKRSREKLVYEIMTSQINAILNSGASLEQARELIDTISNEEHYTSNQKNHLMQLIEELSKKYQERKKATLVKHRSGSTNELSSRSGSTDTEDWNNIDAVIKSRDRCGSLVVPEVDLEVTELEGHVDPVRCLIIQDTRAITGSDDKSCIVWDMNLGMDTHLLKTGAEVTSIALSGDEVITGMKDGSAKYWQLNKEKKSLLGKSGPTSTSLKGHKEEISCCSFIKGSSGIGITGSFDHSLRIWQLDKGKQLEVLAGHTFPVKCMLVRENRIYSGSLDQTLRVWDTETGNQLAVLVGHQGGITHVEVDDNRVITCSEDCTVKIWDRNTRECTITLKDHTDTITCCQSNDNYIVSGSEDSTIKLWDLRKSTTGPTLTFLGHSGRVNAIQWDMTKVLSASQDSTVRLWDFTTGECIYVGQKHEGGVLCLAFNGGTVISTGEDGKVMLWQSNSGSLY